MKTRTIQAYGYEVTGTEDIIKDIEESLNDPNREIRWNEFRNKDMFFGGNGKRIYSATVDHKNKKVLAGKYEMPEWVSLKVGDKVESVSDGLRGTIIEDNGLDYLIQLDNGRNMTIEGNKLSRIKLK